MEKREKEYTNLDQERIVTAINMPKTAKLRKLQTVKIRLRLSNLPTKSRRM